MSFIGEKIRERREALGFNQRYVARELGIGLGTVSRIENGIEPRSSVLKKLSALLQVDVDYFYNEESVSIKPSSNNEELLLEYWRSIPEEEKPSALLLMKRFSEAAKRTNVRHRRKKKSKELATIIPMHSQQKTIPVRLLIDAAAGDPIDAIRQADEVEVPEKYARKNSVAVRARGDSMIGIGIDDHDIVVGVSVRTSKNYKMGDVIIASIHGSEFTIKRYAGHRGGKRYLLPENDAYEILQFSERECQIEAVVIARQDNNGEWHDVEWESVKGRI